MDEIENSEQPTIEIEDTQEEKKTVPLFARFLEKPQRVKTHLKAGLAKACCKETC
jgi:hypothetical protein